MFYNMSAGHHRPIFYPPTLLKTFLRRLKAFFQKKLSSGNFDNFSEVKTFLIFGKNTLNLGEGKIFQETKSFGRDTTATQ